MKSVRAIKRANISSASKWLIARHGIIAKYAIFNQCKSSVIQSTVAEMRFMVGVRFCTDIERLSLL